MVKTFGAPKRMWGPGTVAPVAPPPPPPLSVALNKSIVKLLQWKLYFSKLCACMLFQFAK